MAAARHVFCGQCEANVRPKRQWIIATIEPPHLGGPEAAHLRRRRRLTKDGDGKPDLSGLSTMERLLVDHRQGQFDISIRQRIRDGVTVKEAFEKEYFAAHFPRTDSDELDKQHQKQMKYLFTDKSEVRLAYYLLETDVKKMVVLRCPYCHFQRRLKLSNIEKKYFVVFETGGRLVLSSSGLDVRVDGKNVLRPNQHPRGV